MAERRKNPNWSREETILALELYMMTPFGKICDQLPEVAALAARLGRTPGAVALKMFNLGAHDPAQTSRGVSSLQHGSRVDAEVFKEFYGRWDLLVEQATRIKTAHGWVEGLVAERIPLGTTFVQEISARSGQSFFRNAVLSAYGDKCCVTGLNVPQLLIASYIKPWAQGTPAERTDPCNGLALNGIMDLAFNKGLMTVTPDRYVVRFSDTLRDAGMDDRTRSWLLQYEGISITPPKRFRPCREFLEYHNEMIFDRRTA